MYSKISLYILYVFLGSKVRGHIFTYINNIMWNTSLESQDSWTYCLAKSSTPNYDPWLRLPWDMKIILQGKNVKMPDVSGKSVHKNLHLNWSFLLDSIMTFSLRETPLLIKGDEWWSISIAGRMASSSRDSLVSRTTTRLSCEVFHQGSLKMSITCRDKKP